MITFSSLYNHQQKKYKFKNMKRNILLLALFIFSVTGYAQPLAKTFTKQPVKSIDWGTKSTSFVDGFWEMAAKELEKKFTKKMVDSMVKYGESSMYYASGFDYAKKEDLKLYVVAEFNNNFGGKFRGVKYIVMVPYEENKELWRLDRTKPNDFFLVFPKEAVVLQ